MNKISKILFLIKNPRLIKALMSNLCFEYLNESGWILSYIGKKSVTIDGEACLWMTLPFNKFIIDRLKKD